MHNTYNAAKANIVRSDMEASAAMQTTSAETIKSILNRMGVGFEEGLPKEVYLSALKEEFCSDREWILRIFPRPMLDFLLKTWENEQLDVQEEDWDYLQYLKIFGLAAFKKGNPITKEPNEIYCIQEMRDQFYFLLKSRKSSRKMLQYEEWEKIICGLLYYYGMIETTILHEIFMRVTRQMIAYEEFLLFLKSRCSLWPFGLLLKDTRGEKEYFQYVNVDNPELLLMYIREHRDLLYKNIEKEDLFYVCDAAGIDNRWRGVTELGSLFLDEIHMDYYPATVMIKTLLVMVQNSCEWEELKEKLKILSTGSEAVAERVKEAARLLYEHVPVYELKGYSRAEYEKIFRQKQLKKKKEMFKIIKGKK